MSVQNLVPVLVEVFHRNFDLQVALEAKSGNHQRLGFHPPGTMNVQNFMPIHPIVVDIFQVWAKVMNQQISVIPR